MPALILNPVDTNAILRKKNYKQDAIIFTGSSHIEINFILRAELIVIQMRFFKIYVEELSLKKLFL